MSDQPDLMAALVESLRDKFVCTCGRKFVSHKHADGHLEPRPRSDGFHFCGGDLASLAPRDSQLGRDADA